MVTEDLREKIADMIKKGFPTREIAKQLRISTKTVQKIKKELFNSGKVPGAEREEAKEIKEIPQKNEEKRMEDEKIKKEILECIRYIREKFWEMFKTVEKKDFEVSEEYSKSDKIRILIRLMNENENIKTLVLNFDFSNAKEDIQKIRKITKIKNLNVEDIISANEIWNDEILRNYYLKNLK